MKPFRKFLTTQALADSYVAIESSYGDVNLKIADCDKAVSLSFSYNKVKHTKASLKKLSVLEFALKEIREELEAHLQHDHAKGNGI